MKKKYTVSFREVKSPITKPITKFGGQPVWIEKPEWAISKSTGKPMMFICQIALDEEIFGRTESKMAYLFMTDEDIDATFDPNSGENAVVIQPNGKNPFAAEIATGDSLYSIADGFRHISKNHASCEFLAELLIGEDPDSNDEMDEEFINEAMAEIKIGGTPIFLQNDEYPDEYKENWRLLLQIDSCSVPFDINFGDAGVGYAFISKNGKIGKFLWQCC